MKACLRSAQQDGRILRRIWDECGIEGVWFMKSILREKLQECQRTVEKCKARQAAAFEDYAEGRIRKQEYLSRKKEISGQQEEAANLSDSSAYSLAASSCCPDISFFRDKYSCFRMRPSA